MKDKIKKGLNIFLNAKCAFILGTFNSFVMIVLLIQSPEIVFHHLIAFIFGLSPSILFYYRVYLANKDKKMRKFINHNSMFLLIPYIFYLIIWYLIFACLSITTPETKMISYKVYYDNFPSKKSFNHKDAKYYHTYGVLQAGDKEILYLKASSKFIDEYIDKYKDNTVELHKDENVNLYTMDYKGLVDVDESYDLYLIESRCDDSGYCNHGVLKFILIKEETNEIVFYGSAW